MTLFLFAAALGCTDKEVLPWLRELGLTEPCARCAGSGFYDRFEQIRCFKCGGKGDQLPKLTLELARETARLVVAGRLQPYLERKRRQVAARAALPGLVVECVAYYRKLRQAEVTPLFFAPGIPLSSLPAGAIPPEELATRIDRHILSVLDAETAEVSLRAMRDRLLALAAEHGT